MAELLLELLSEEIPARMQARAADDLKRFVSGALKKAELEFDQASAYVTPRRLCLSIAGLPVSQEDQREERRGPKVDAPEKAINGFLHNVGLARSDCEERETDKGRFLFTVIEHKGRPTTEVLQKILVQALQDLSWPKSMRWGSGDTRWVRPLHSILALFDGGVVTFEFAGVPSGNQTSGHRFHAPEKFSVTEFADYQKKLRQANVVLDSGERRKLILDGARELAAAAGFTLNEDPGLVDEITGLVEWPVPILGNIDARFMVLPREVLVSSMKSHQKYLSANNQDGGLAPCFITVSNIQAADSGKQIAAGNQYVLTARLADAEFFYDNDSKTRLDARLPELERIVYHAKLGSVGDKAKRLAWLSSEIADLTNSANRDRAFRAGHLAKADLVTEMVGEFPELQGLMGRYYALNDGEDALIADAIAAHYSPAGPNDLCPNEATAICVALADKLDTLTGFWSIDEKPTGSKDPFALRRAALGIIRLILENDLRIGLRELFHRGFNGFSADTNLSDDLLKFFTDRLKVHLREQGRRHDLIAAIFALGYEDDLVRLTAKLTALTDFLETDNGNNLLTAYRRAANILRIEEKNDGQCHDDKVNPTLLRQAEEKALAEALNAATTTAKQESEAENFAAAMTALSNLRPPVDAFFDEVTVNVEETEIRANRLALLAALRTTLHTVADFSEIEG